MCDKQITSASIKFLDAFHNVHNAEAPTRFFMDERKTKGGITLTDNFYLLGEQYQYDNLAAETESRRRLVETAWELNLPKHLIQVDYKEESREFFADNKLRRVPVTAASPSLNGYQKGRCFYCFREISIDNNHQDFADVDHFFPHAYNCSITHYGIHQKWQPAQQGIATF